MENKQLKEQQDKRWNELNEEAKEFNRKEYAYFKQSFTELGIKIAKDYENFYGSHNLRPKPLTYEDVARGLFGGVALRFSPSNFDTEESYLVEEPPYGYMDWDNCTSEKQAEKLIAINKLLNVAKYLNGDWTPDWEDYRQLKYGIDITDGEITVTHTATYQTSIVYFCTEELARQAIQILGEETIRLAQTTDY